MKFEIKNRWSGEVVFSVEAESWRVAVEAAYKAKANLCEANLRRADLRGANLCRADLRRADLCRANLCEADLREADLREADLCEADLCGADLREADLREADLCGADLCEADLCEADLCRADLRRADLCGADLRGAKNLERFPISVLLNRHGLFTTTDGKLAIGCRVYTFEEWLRHADKIGQAENYSAVEIEIYKLAIQFVQKSSQLLWNAGAKEKT